MIEGTKIGRATVSIIIDFSDNDIYDFFRRPLSEVSDKEILDIVRMHPAMVDDAAIVIDRDEE